MARYNTNGPLKIIASDVQWDTMTTVEQRYVANRALDRQRAIMQAQIDANKRRANCVLAGTVLSFVALLTVIVFI